MDEANVTLRIYDAKSLQLLGCQRASNRIVVRGRDDVRDLIGNLGYSLNMISWGANGTAVTDIDSALGSESYWRLLDRRVAGASCLYAQARLDASSGNGLVFQEAGLWFGPWTVDDTRAGLPSSGSRPVSTLFARTVFDAITKSSSIVLDTTWQVTIANTA